MTYRFTALTPADLPLLDRWLKAPHVREWWEDDEGLAEAEEAYADPDTWQYIVHLGDRPIGYIQAYNPHAWPGHHFGDQPPGARGVDQYIGEADLLNQGHGPAFIRQFCDQLIAAGAPVVCTDPHPGNARAIRAYEKAGFATYGGPVDTDWGRSLLMARRG